MLNKNMRRLLYRNNIYMACIINVCCYVMDLCESCKLKMSKREKDEILKEVKEYKIKYTCFHRYQQLKNI